ncbi:3-hydroxyacyl-CoA dehydrogenase family protein [Planctomicrobium sp. SH661]|uniref:3-hydroxyacyl-CoA dehydrogenase family protein n=1 Tax=Planctomicrobium sp. SH661 TaxID=3448124 RepID=UPI003F5B79A0
MAIQTVGIVGLGLLGRGIATCLLSRGLNVVAFDRDAAVVESAREHIESSLQDMAARGAVPKQMLSEWPGRITLADSLQDFAGCDFVIESVFENLDLKREIFRELEDIIGAAVPLGSNTSALPIHLLQHGMKHPERVVGMHWAEPCHMTRFLEVIRGEQTNDATADAAVELGRLAGKDPALLNKDIAGFIVNRLAYAMYREAFHLLEQGVADVETIDKSFSSAMSVWTNLMGPFRWMDLTGLPAYASVMQRLFPELSRSVEVPAAMQKLMDSGAKGIANGSGFYEYAPEDKARWERLLTENVWQVNQMLKALSVDGEPSSLS